MKKYIVLITERNHGSVVIKAKDEMEASEMAKQMVWDSDSLTLSREVWEDTEVEVSDIMEAEKDESLTKL